MLPLWMAVVAADAGVTASARTEAETAPMTARLRIRDTCGSFQEVSLGWQ